jgi:hypothetical protein
MDHALLFRTETGVRVIATQVVLQSCGMELIAKGPVTWFTDQPFHKFVLCCIIGKENMVDIFERIRRLKFFHFLIISICNF